MFLSSFHGVGKWWERAQRGTASFSRGVVMGPFGVFTHTGQRGGGWRTNSSSQERGGGQRHGHSTVPLAGIIYFFLALGSCSHYSGCISTRRTVSYEGESPDPPPQPAAASHCLVSGNTGQALALTFCALVPAAPVGGDKDRGKGLSWGDTGCGRYA